MTNILKRKILYHVKKSFKCINLFFVLVIAIVAVIAYKYKPSYSVTINGQIVGYVKNKNDFEARINNEVLAHTGNIAFVTINQYPNYNLEFVSRNEETSEDKIIENIKQNAEVTYKFYAVTLNQENKAYVNTFEEAQTLVADLKAEHSGKIDLDIGISEYYTESFDDAQKIEETADVEIAKDGVEAVIQEYINRETQTVNGVYLATIPVNGRITSRYGSIESVRSGAHTGLDIGAAGGTPIKVAADGVVTHSSWCGSYGNLVVVSHGNGIETYYAHASRLNVKVGQQVKAGDVIAFVGSTGNSTGNHLHFEVRIDGRAVNPQKYLYR